jgi:flavin reductase (DIM6/NTAB) family NADH-FMN oxidoreductase RutF
MNLTIADLDRGRAYALLTNLVVPRPIAWVTSQNTQGLINLAPFSFFNMVGSAPPTVVIGVGDESPGQPKHTAKNIAATREFVVNLVTPELAAAMNITASDFPATISELDAAGLHAAPSQRVKVPRVAEAKASLECTLHSIQRIGGNNVIFGEIVALHVDDAFIDASLHIHDFTPVGRLGSPDLYCRTGDRFAMRRMTFSQWQASQAQR